MILIRNLDELLPSMPDSCAKCPLSDGSWCHAINPKDGQKAYHFSSSSRLDYYDKRSAYCPLVEVDDDDVEELIELVDRATSARKEETNE